MCTVSFCINQGEVIFTSNRDERTIRPASTMPMVENVGSKNIIYPKDPQSGGTWIGCDDWGNCIILLNGGFEMHQLKEKYRMSRGIIVKESIGSNDPLKYIKEVELSDIEPFQVILYGNGRLDRMVWDGSEKHFFDLDIEKTHIFSSVTLYDEKMRSDREMWWEDFLKSHEINGENIFKFHSTYKSEDRNSGLVINRENIVKTYSVSQIILNNNQGKFKHLDMQTNESKTIKFTIADVERI